MKEFNYYLKTHDNKPTAVVIVKLNNIIARGVAICNPKDHFNRKRGRMIAKGRALKALSKGRPCVNSSILRSSAKNKVPSEFKYKADCEPVLTNLEINLLSQRIAKNSKE